MLNFLVCHVFAAICNSTVFQGHIYILLLNGTMQKFTSYNLLFTQTCDCINSYFLVSIIPLRNGWGVFLVRVSPFHSIYTWRDTHRVDLPLASSQHRLKICSLFLPYNKKCGQDWLGRPGQQSLPQSHSQIAL